MSMRNKEDLATLNDEVEQDADSTIHLEIVRIIDRLYRRYTDLMRVDLTRLGNEDVSPSQIMMLFTIGGGELSVRDLLDRGYYLGSNASYNLKQLVDGNYIEREISSRDRRSARISLSAKGQALCDEVRRCHDSYHREIARDPVEARNLEVTYQVLRRLEDVWTATLRYGELAPVNGTPAQRRAAPK
jgi:DNA-binding MarR family transcriptional regulator